VGVDEHTIEFAGAPVFYRRAPATGDPVLYLHGVPTSSDDVTPFLERTGGIAPDLPGFGRSAKGGNLDYSLEGHANFIERLLEQLGVERVRLFAHDWGAGGGLTFALRHPDRVTRLVLCNALPLLPSFHWHRLARLIRRPLLGELVMGSTTKSLLARTLRSGAVNPDSWPDARVDSVWEQFDQGTQRATLRLYRDASEDRLAEAGKGLASLATPTLVLWGERDPWLAAEFADAYASRLPYARAERLPEAGHWPWLDQPDVIERVAAFLEDDTK
jgi:pimeloyl-ACP methyl ester carboxylesterase